MRGMYASLSEWIKNYPNLKSWLYFNTVDMSEGNTSLNSTGTHKKVKEYIDGSYEAELPFGISMVMMYDTEQSDINHEAFEEASNFMDWVENADPYPDFGEHFTVTGIYLYDQSPEIMVDTQQALAKYTFYGVVEYTYNT